MQLGFIGTGAITSAMVSGLCAADAGQRIWLSPRNAGVAAKLAARYPGAAVAGSNQDVLDACETVVLAVRPPLARGVLAALRFRPEHRVVSVMAGLARRQLAELVAPAGQVTRAVPLPAAAERRSTTAIFPPDPVVAALFASLGSTVEVETEDEFEALAAATATLAAHFTFSDSIAAWLTRQGVPAAKARDYVAKVILGLAAAAVDAPDRSFRELAGECATPGGMNEQVLRHLTENGVFERVSEGLDGILRRVRAAAPGVTPPE